LLASQVRRKVVDEYILYNGDDVTLSLYAQPSPSRAICLRAAALQTTGSESAAAGAVATARRLAIQRNKPRAVQLAFAKGAFEGFLFVAGTVVATIMAIWLFTSSAVGSAASRAGVLALLALGLLLQFSWARTCWFCYQMLRRNRGGALDALCQRCHRLTHLTADVTAKPRSN
jgi:hypothetical protein